MSSSSSSSSSSSTASTRELPSARFSLQSLFAAVKDQDRSKGDLLAQSNCVFRFLVFSLSNQKIFVVKKIYYLLCDFIRVVDLAMLHEIKREISLTTKKSYTLEKDIRSLDQKIALLIRNRISLEVSHRSIDYAFLCDFIPVFFIIFNHIYNTS